VAPHVKHSLHNFTTVEAVNISRQVIAIAVTLVDPSFKCFIHSLLPFYGSQFFQVLFLLSVRENFAVLLVVNMFEQAV